MGSNIDPMLEIFLFETNQLIDTLEDILIEGERASGLSKEDINEVFRCMHTIKGSSAMMSFNNISSLTHAAEDLFAYIRENESKQYDWSEICDLILEVVDFTKEEMSKIEHGENPDGDEKELATRIRSYISNLDGSSVDSAYDKVTDSAASNVSGIGNRKYKVIIFFEDNCKMENLRAFSVVNSLNDIAEDLITVPENLFADESDVNEQIINNGFHLYFNSNESEESIKEILEKTIFLKSLEIEVNHEIKSDKELSINNSGSNINESDQIESRSNNKIRTASVSNNKQNFISVNVNKLDNLLDLVGELVIAESMLRVKNSEDFNFQAYEKSQNQLHKITEQLRDVVMSVRMVPVAATFNKMNRLVRDMSKKTGKDVELIIKGEQTEVDKNIIDNLSDPLMHIIRNSIDHGIEDEEERLKLNKPAYGRILLEAYNSGGEVYINIVDDGKGLDRDKILDKAIKRGLYKGDPSKLTDREVYSFIMQPGFSTNETVTEFSGRGVGMDIVKQSIEKIGGSIIIESEKGKGTAITLKIPLTLAIIDGMSIQSGEQLFIVPTLSIYETFIPNKENLIIEPNGEEFIILRDKCYPLIRLNRIFNIEDSIKDITEGRVILTNTDNSGVCILVDKILEEQQIVFKPVPGFITENFGDINGISGCTILGDGSVRFVLDVKMLSNLAAKVN